MTSSVSSGKQHELKVISELLARGFDVYQPLVDDKGIDCVIRLSQERYLDIQIKGRSKDCSVSQQGFFPQMKVREPRENYFFILYSERSDDRGEYATYWVIPSQDIRNMAEATGNSVTEMKTGPRTGKISVRVLTTIGERIERFDEYQDDKGFALLR